MAVFTGSIFNDTIIPGNVSPFVIRFPFTSPSNAIDSLFGNGGNDTLDGGGGNDLVDGGSGNDIMRGGSGNDTMLGGTGNDSMDGGSGNDVMRGGDGNDTMRGGGGIDSVFGENGNDVIYSSGQGTYDGGAGNDTIYAGLGTPETLRGGAGVDWLDTTTFGGNYVVNLTTGATNFAGESFTQFENLRSGSGADLLIGTAGANVIYAGAGNDIVSGNAGNDTIRGEAGADIVNGGLGADTFQYLSTNDSAGAARDLLVGFDGAGFAAGDVINLAAIDANTAAGFGGNQAFNFLGVAANAAGIAAGAGSLWVNNVGAETVVWGNTDFDATIEFSIRIADGGTVAANYWAGDSVL